MSETVDGTVKTCWVATHESPVTSADIGKTVRGNGWEARLDSVDEQYGCFYLLDANATFRADLASVREVLRSFAIRREIRWEAYKYCMIGYPVSVGDPIAYVFYLGNSQYAATVRTPNFAIWRVCVSKESLEAAQAWCAAALNNEA